MLAKVFLFVLFHYSSAVIYELSDDDYAHMPTMFLMDDYEQCFENPEGLYCTAKFAMVSDEPSPLLNMMQEYSEKFSTHYNHTMVRRGICITKTCKKYYEVSEGDLGSTLEACANETFYNEYKLKARVLPDFECSKRERNLSIDSLDIAVAVVCIAILAANIIASISDYYSGKERISGGLRFLYCFSIFRNWKRLVTPAAAGRELRLRRFISLHGVRTLTMFLVIGGHSVIENIFLPENERFIENMFNTGPMHILLSGTLIMQTFLFISSFLLIYNCLIHSEKTKLTWKMLPHMFMMRWLRLTPSYGLVLALTATWFGKLSSGPSWENLVVSQVHECRRVWWKHLLYINNYFDKGECMLQSWYLAADTQLYFMACIVFVLCQTPRMRKMVLSLMFVIGIAIPTLITYLQDLDGCLIVYPEFSIKVFTGDRTFEEIFRKGHANIPGYVIGMALAYWVYDREKTGADLGNLRKYRWVYWSLLPLGVLCCYSGTVYYSDAPPPSTIINLVYAAFMKPAFAIIISFTIIGAIFQCEDVYRSILEWSVWTIPSRLSFSALLVHIAIIRHSLAVQTTTYRASPMTVSSLDFSKIPSSDIDMVTMEPQGKHQLSNKKGSTKSVHPVESYEFTTGLTVIAQSFIAALFYHILVEGPFTSLIREWFTKPEPIEGTKEKETKKIEEDGDINGSLKTNGVAITSKGIGSTRKRVLNKIGSS